MLVKLSSSPIEENYTPRHLTAIKTHRMCLHHVCLNMCTLQDLTRYVYCGDDDHDHDFVDDNHDFVDDDHDIVDDDHDIVDDDDHHDIDAVISSITSHLSINFISSINLTHLIRLSISCIYLSHPSISSIHSSIISVQILDGVQVYEARSRMGEKLALKILKVLGE